MITRRTLLAAALAPAGRFRAEMGLALYSLRNEAEKDLPRALKVARELGFRDVEAGELYRRTPSAFARLLRDHGLRAVSLSASWDSLVRDAGAVAADAHALGASFVVCSTIPHSAKHLAEADCAPAARQLNRAGEELARTGLRLCYHTHGTEFDASSGGTRFDTLVRLCDPRFVAFEMDIFWIVYGGQDPATLLRRYPGRFPLLHVKDIRRGTVLGLTPADVEENDSVPLGAGLVDVRSALLAAQETGVQHYFLEEEAVDPVPQIRQSLRFLAGLR